MSTKPMSNVAVVLGTMPIGAPDDRGTVRITTHEGLSELLDVFQKYGHSDIDTARGYGNGTTEQYLGAIGWQERGLKMETKLYPSKGRNVGWFFDGEELSHSPADLRKGLKDSLGALKTDKLSILYLHAPDRNVPFEDTLGEINKIYEEGVFERFGLCNFMSWEVAKVCEICKRNGWVVPTAYQATYNAFERQIEAELIPCLRAYGISFYGYHPLAAGLLTSRYTRDQTVFTEDQRYNPERMMGKLLQRRYWNDAIFTALELLRPVLATHGITESEAALRWLRHHSVLKKELGDAIVMGASSTKQLEDNLQALEKGPLPEDVVKAMDACWEHTRSLPSPYYH